MEDYGLFSVHDSGAEVEIIAADGDHIAVVYGNAAHEMTAADYANLLASAPELLAACKVQHEAIDRLMARLITLDTGFLPSQSGQPWEALVQGNKAIKKAEVK
jgi:hypothetical protein